MNESHITTDDIIQKLHECTPRLAWAMSEAVLMQIRRLKKADGTYIWKPDLIHDGYPGFMLGIEIIISQAVMEPGYELVIIKKDGSIQILEK